MEYPVKEGDIVVHVKDDSLVGIITHIDRNLEHPTTCNVRWDGYFEDDIQWTDKIIKQN